MFTALERTNIDHHVQRPGIAVISWRDSRSVLSGELDEVLHQTASENQAIRFAHVDTRRHGRLASEWGVDQVPSVMVFRDGQLLGGLSRGESVLDVKALLARALGG